MNETAATPPAVCQSGVGVQLRMLKLGICMECFVILDKLPKTAKMRFELSAQTLF